MLAQMGMAPSATCECDAEEQTVDHVGQCNEIPHGLYGLTVPDDETIESLLNTCPKSSAAKQWIVHKNWLKRRRIHKNGESSVNSSQFIPQETSIVFLGDKCETSFLVKYNKL